MTSAGAANAALLLATLLAGVFGARTAAACASCTCGDATLTSLGQEQPFAGRVRSALELSYRRDALGTPGVDELNVRELRADAALAWAPFDALFLGAKLPFVHRRARDPSLAESESWGLGDIELHAKAFLFRDRAFAPRWLLAALVGVKLPTAPWQLDATGAPVPLEVQPGTGSLDLLLGPSLSAFHGDFSAYASVQGALPIVTRAPLEPGRSLRGSVALQHQSWTALAFRAAMDGRWDQPSREAGERAPNSGGLVLFAGGDVLVSPALDLSLSLGVRLPVLNALDGAHAEGPRASLALTRDW